MELIVQKRELLGKRIKSLLQQGLIPAELYGHGIENTHLSVSRKDFIRIFKEAGESTTIKLKVSTEEGSEFNVLVHDFQKNPLTDEINHIDFYSVKVDEKIRVKVPLEFIGEAPAVKEKGGILVKAIHDIEVEALPADLPHNFKIDLSALSDIGSNIYIKDIDIPKGVKIFINIDTVAATITELVEEKVVETPASVEDIKVETEEKKEKREQTKEQTE